MGFEAISGLLSESAFNNQLTQILEGFAVWLAHVPSAESCEIPTHLSESCQNVGGYGRLVEAARDR